MSLSMPQDFEMDAMDIKVKIDCDDEGEPFFASKNEVVHNSGIVGSCPKCGQTFKMRRFLLAHKLKCNRTKPNYTSNNYHDYKSAVKRAKRSSKPIKLFACDLCPKFYRQKQGLVIHKEVAHKIGPGSTPSPCPQCPKTFQTAVRLRSHFLLTHRYKESSLKCTQCETKFVEENILALHIRNNKCGREPFKCPHCELDFEFKCSWKRHLENCDKLTLAFPCTFPNCSRVFTTKKKFQQHHYNAHPLPKPLPPPCPECGKQFSDKKALGKHRKIHEPDYKKLNCSYCHRKFKNPAELRNHERFSRGESNDNKNQYCTQCSTNFSFKCQYKAHAPDQQCEKCQLHFTCRTIYMNHNCEGTPGPQAGGYPCFPCSKIFPKLHNWRIHSYTHLRQVTGKTFPCQEPGCGKSYNNPNCLTSHKHSVHSIDKKKKPLHLRKFVRLDNGDYPCVEPGCNKTFTKSYNLTVHLQGVHLGKKYTCEICGISINRKENFKRHQKLGTCFKKKRKSSSQKEGVLKPEVQKLRTKSKPALTSSVSIFSCKSCHQTFAREISLQRHLNLNQSKKTTCEFCSTKFDLDCGFRLHIKNQLTCSNPNNPKCDFSTNCKLNYAKHQESCIPSRKNTPEKEVKVEHCVSNDYVESTSVVDSNIDPGGPFYCWACGQLEFNLRTSFYNHIRIVHGQEPE